MNNLKEKYTKIIAPKIKEEYSLKSVMQVPRLKKVVINAGVGGFKDNREALESFEKEFTDLAGQKYNERKARLSIAGFKLKKGDLVGLTATLRGDRMWAFLEKLINVALPRVRDFSGLSAEAFDNSGNYSLGVAEHTIFPEVNQNTVKGIRGIQVTLVSSSNDIKLNKALFTYLGMPFDNKN